MEYSEKDLKLIARYQEKLAPNYKIIKFNKPKLDIELPCGHIRTINSSHINRPINCLECEFTCPICSKVIKGEDRFKKHMTAHTLNIKPPQATRLSDQQLGDRIVTEGAYIKETIDTEKHRKIKIGYKDCEHERVMSMNQLESNLLCLECYPRESSRFSSKSELELLEYTRTFYPSARKSNTNEFLQELDIYIPELKIAFEYNRFLLALY